jgi:acyl-homoserine-lactone acylase
VVTALVLVAGLVQPVAAGAQAAAGEVFDATIKRDSFGVPHIVARDVPSLGFGIGYAFAEDNLCTLMDYTVTVRGERSKWFGPDGSWTFGGNGTSNKNLDSDFFYKSVNQSGVVERLVGQAAPHGPLPDVRAAVRGYATGINQYLQDVGGAAGIEDPRCKGADWVRPLTEIDVYRRFFQLATMASSGVAITGIAKAQPPAGGLVPVVPGVTDSLPLSAEQLDAVSRFPAKFNEAIGIGSNAFALGSAATDNGMGMVLGNPHFPWHGGERLYQMQLTVPGKINVSGAGLYGVPIVLIGHTDGVAWSHTVSTAFRFTPFELTLAPGDPTSYLVDGQAERMTSQDLSVEVREPDGSVGTRTRTLWSTRYGPMLNSLLGLPLFPWTPVKAFALSDANVQMRYLNQFFLWNQAQSVDELFDIQKEYLSVPWVNTIAADRSGQALYSDVSTVPNVPDAKATGCSGVLGLVTFTALGLPTLDGARSECGWDTDTDAIVPGIFGPGNLPHVVRTDFVTNGNDSFWLSNPDARLEGYARIIGDQRTDRSLRTRLGLKMVQERLAGTDEYDTPAGNRFTQDILQQVVFNNRQYAGELVRDDLVALCRSLGGTALTSAPGTVPLDNACDVLAGWDLRDDLDSAGAILFRRFWANLTAKLLPLDVADIVRDKLPPELLPLLPDSLAVAEGVPWTVPFSLDDPVNTPRDLDTLNPRVALALGDAVADLRAAGIPLDAGLRGWQYEVKGDTAYPVHGGPGTFGVFNAISAVWNGQPGPRAGYSDIVHGSSFVMAAHFVDPATNDGCGVDADAIVTYSQSEDETRPFFANQTAMFGEKQWNPMYFCDAELASDPGLEVVQIRSTPVGGRELARTGGSPSRLLPLFVGLALLGWVATRRLTSGASR